MNYRKYQIRKILAELARPASPLEIAQIMEQRGLLKGTVGAHGTSGNVGAILRKNKDWFRKASGSGYELIGEIVAAHKPVAPPHQQ